MIAAQLDHLRQALATFAPASFSIIDNLSKDAAWPPGVFRAAQIPQLLTQQGVQLEALPPNNAGNTVVESHTGFAHDP